jgi:hypothetical protein
MVPPQAARREMRGGARPGEGDKKIGDRKMGCACSTSSYFVSYLFVAKIRNGFGFIDSPGTA